MAIKTLSALTAKISTVLSPAALQTSLGLNSLTSSSSAINTIKSNANIGLGTSTITNAFNSLISNITIQKPSAVDLGALTTSLPKLMDMMKSLTSGAGASGNSDTLNSLMQTLQPLLQNLNSGSGAQQSDLLKSLPQIIDGMQNMLGSINHQGNSADSISSAVTAMKPLLDILSSANSSTDISKITAALGQLFEIAQPILQSAGNLTAGKADLGDIAQSAAQTLMPLLGSIDTGSSNIDMAKLQQALPAVAGSLTTLVAALSQANEGNIPETVASVIKGVKPMLKMLENSGSLDANQADTVHKVYDVLNSVQTILDLVNSPSLITLSSDLNNVMNALKPVVAMIDQNGEFSTLLNSTQVPSLNDLLQSASKSAIDTDSMKSAIDQLTHGSSADLPNISDLLHSGTASGAIDLSQIAPQLTAADAASSNSAVANTLPHFDLAALTSSLPSSLNMESSMHYV